MPKSLLSAHLAQDPAVWQKVWESIDLPSPLENKYNGVEDLAARMVIEDYLLPSLAGKDYLVLEAGCGTAQHSLLLSQKGAFIVGLDFSKGALRIAEALFKKAKLYEYACFIVGDVLALPFRDDTFNIVWNQGVVEHFEGKERQIVINEMARVTKRGYLVAILVPCALNMLRPFLKLCGPDVESPYTPAELKSRLFNAGLKVVCSSGTHFVFPFDFIFKSCFRYSDSKMQEISKSKLLRRILGIRRIKEFEKIYAFFGHQIFRLARKL